MTTDRPEAVRLVAARNRIRTLQNDIQLRWVLAKDAPAYRAIIDEQNAAIAELERAAAEAAFSALPCLRVSWGKGASAETGLDCEEAIRRGSANQHRCPTCTARRAREEAT